MDDSSRSISFRGTDRFQVVRRLGAGAMGVVYEALDRETRAHVALKTLRLPTPELLTRLKKEFRALQDFQHPNLVSLGELIEDAGQWFFTMELVRGVSFLEHVRPGESASMGLGYTATDVGVASGHGAPPVAPPRSPLDLGRLRDALAQLTRGLLALHEAGKVHRDIKPNNMLVTPESRLVLLDFGLVLDFISAGSTEGGVVGTAAYMSPEQAASQPVGPEADWYAVGAVLYEALTGVPPFVGPPLAVLMDKQRSTPRLPSKVTAGVPADLETLCMALLQFEPASRPTGREVLRRLGQAPPGPVTSLSQVPPFVGRSDELAFLQQAFAEVRDGQALTVMVHGESGVGKSALVRRFTERAHSAEPRLLVLAGRCYEREAVPYKAVDGVMDALGRYLQHKLPRGTLLPRRAGLLTQVFSALHKVDALMDLAPQIVPDPQELRTRMFAGARDLLADIAARQPLILVIDDLQWADADSLALLGELVRPPDAPALLLLCTWRAGAEAVEEVKRRLRLPGEGRELELQPLAAAAARELAVELLTRAGSSTARAEAIAREAGGHPLFIDELVRHGGDVPVKLEDALWERISGLDPAARRVLEIVALADSPIEQEVAARASGLGVGELRRHAGLLRVANLARTGGIRATDTMEPFHDRVRETVIAHLAPDESMLLHRDLARAMERSGRAAPDALALQFRAAGEPEIAARYAAKAALQSTGALAFDRAADFYRMALELGHDEPQLRVHLADALANAGRGAEAAQVYQQAASVAPASESIDLQRRAAQQFLTSGHIDEGLTAMHGVLESEGIREPRTPKGLLLRALWQRAFLRLRGLKFKRRHASDVSERQLARIDFCWHAGIGLGMGDHVRGSVFNAQGLILSLRAGEPFRLLRAMVLETAYLGAIGRTAARRTERLQTLAKEIAEGLGTPHPMGLVLGGLGAAEFLLGRFASARAACEAADPILREQCAGVPWEIATTTLFHARSLVYLGDMRALAERVPVAMREFTDRGDLYGATSLRSAVLPFVRLLADAPDAAAAEAVRAKEDWTTGGFHVQHYYALYSHVSVRLYRGDGEGAARLIEESERALQRSLLLRVQSIRISMLELGARTALARAGHDGKHPEHIAQAARAARRIRHERMPWGDACAALIEAGVTAARGDRADAAARYDVAVRLCEASGMALHAAVARLRRGELLGNDEGRALALAADAWMRGGCGIENPESWARMVAP